MDNMDMLTNMYNTTLEAILVAKEKKGLTDAEFERLLNLSPKTVDNWKRGKSKTYMKMLTDVASLLGVLESSLSVLYVDGEQSNLGAVHVSGAVSDGAVVQGVNSGNIIMSKDGRELSDEAAELLRLYDKMGIENKIELLQKAVELGKKDN